jgi:hypothetical protein
MRWLHQVRHLMHHHNIQAFAWFRQIHLNRILADTRLQLPHFVFIRCTKNRSTRAHQRFPFREKLRHRIFELNPVSHRLCRHN